MPKLPYPEDPPHREDNAKNVHAPPLKTLTDADRCSFGVDALKVWLPYIGEPQGQYDSAHQYSSGSQRVVMEVDLLNDYAVDVSFDGRRLSIALNPARAVYPTDWGLLPVDALLPLMERVVAQVASQTGVQVTAPIADARVTRVDIARDFIVADPGRYILALAAYKRRSVQRDNTIRWSAKDRAWTSLHIGSKHEHVRLYAKHPEADEVEVVEEYDDFDSARPHGSTRALSQHSTPRRDILRFEIQATNHWLVKHDLKRLGNITSATAQAFLEDRWKWSLAGRWIEHPGVLIDLIHRDSDLTPINKLALIGWVAAQQNGTRPQIDPRLERKFNDALDRIGVPDRPLLDQPNAPRQELTGSRGRLLLEEGREERMKYVRRRSPRRSPQ